MARRSKLTTALIDQISTLVSDGVPLEVAAKASGISSRTYYRWFKRGEEAKTGLYCQFWQSLTRAKASSEARLISVVTRAADNGEWRAAIALLERLYPDRYARHRQSRTGSQEAQSGPWRFVVGGDDGSGYRQYKRPDSGVDIRVNLVEVPTPIGDTNGQLK